MADNAYVAQDMTEKVCVVTGANSGIGLATCRELAAAGASVIMICRNRERGLAARDEVAAVSTGPAPELLLCDFAELACVHDTAAAIADSKDRVDVLIDNAGMIAPERMVTVDGYELTFQVNHLASFLLTHELRAMIDAAPASRVITVSSGAHAFAGKGMVFDDLQLERGWSPFKAYAQSKLANILFAYELCARLGGTGATSNALHPGAVRTGFGWGLGRFYDFVLGLSQPFLRSPEKGAETIVYLATAAEVEGISGGYFHDMEPIDSSAASRDASAARRLWEMSEEMVGIT
jgi:NAD(P)-dependent dehydrogenase (short-subunit alcohol dehydrogenase family)